MDSIGDYNEIMSDRNLFNKVVYTPLSEALRLLEERQKDPVLVTKIEELLKGNIPEIFKKSPKNAVLFRQLATPNHEARYFHSLATEFDLQPIFFEYLDDKFTSNNEYKHSLGQLRIQQRVNKQDTYPLEKISIVDFAKHDGKKIKDVSTLANESLVEFHRKLFTHYGYNTENMNFYNASDWLKGNGEKAINYYKFFFLLFICHGILFENFLAEGKESDFTKKIVLPAIDDVITLTGLKPLIVPIAPMDTETDEHWISYNPKIKKII